MKSYLAVIAAALLTAGVVACGGNGDSTEAAKATVCGQLGEVREDIRQVRNAALADDKSHLEEAVATTATSAGQSTTVPARTWKISTRRSEVWSRF